MPGREGFETNREIAAVYGNGGDVAPIVPVVTLPAGTTVDSPGVARELDAALAKVKAALPDARIASYALDRATARSSPRTAARRSRSSTSRRSGGRRARPGGGPRARRPRSTGVTVGGAPVDVTGLDALRAGAAPAAATARA